MTILVALRCENETWIGSDTMAVDEGCAEYTERKWRRYGRWWIAISGDCIIGHEIHEHRKTIFPELKDGAALTRRLRPILIEAKIMTPEENGEYRLNGSLLLASTDAVWRFDCALYPTRVRSGRLGAAGSGRQFALAADFRRKGCAPERVRTAIGAAIHYCINCGGRVWTRKI